ncbi:hypothetical protein D4T97_006055 [Siminovitchia acidinfaciens]|uniref:Protein YoqH n=1 Tax=Siminovitchia acidinfaciens TaxID=2321395 RepID=A0A429Y4K1_9BACI|nr:hypothetical protein [Siminovitchia acidinfaciens]RST76333.1 hypothetical protein D4T97_006055 [Siminovitchia acidinfaciens]
MNRFVLIIFLIAACVTIPYQTHAAQMPCSLVLEPVDKKLKNAKGAALVYKVQVIPNSFARTNVSMIAVHLPDPSSYGDYDRYESYVFVPRDISWRFELYPTPEDGPTWAGRFDLITAKMDNVNFHVKLSNSKNKKLGPSVLKGHLNSCLSKTIS